MIGSHKAKAYQHRRLYKTKEKVGDGMKITRKQWDEIWETFFYWRLGQKMLFLSNVDENQEKIEELVNTALSRQKKHKKKKEESHG